MCVFFCNITDCTPSLCVQAQIEAYFSNMLQNKALKVIGKLPGTLTNK